MCVVSVSVNGELAGGIGVFYAVVNIINECNSVITFWSSSLITPQLRL